MSFRNCEVCITGERHRRRHQAEAKGLGDPEYTLYTTSLAAER